jgi:hypothetical protein
MKIDSAGAVKAVVGANVSPDVFREGIRVTGSLSALFDGGSILTNFTNETEAALYVYLFADSTAASEFVIIKVPNSKINGANKSTDGPAVQLSGNYSGGLLADGSTTVEQTSIVYHDSTAT